MVYLALDHRNCQKKKIITKWSRPFPECKIQQLYLRTSGEIEKNRITATWSECRKEYRPQQKS